MISTTKYHQFSEYYWDKYRYGYNGMEKDNEVKGHGNSYTTEFRQYDPRVGRWLSIDPVTHPWQSPYCSMDNNPINVNDVFGLYGSKRKAERKQQKASKKYGDDRVGSVYDRNSRDESGKANYGFQIFGEGKNANTGVDGNGSVVAYRPDAIIDRDSDLSKYDKESSGGGWREKYFGWLLDVQKSGSAWTSEQSSKMTTAVRQMDEIMKPHKDEAIGTMKGLYTIYGTAGGSGVASGIRLAKPTTYLYHYTNTEGAKAIKISGLTVTADRPLIYLTNAKNLYPLQAQIELGLQANRAMPSVMLKIKSTNLSPIMVRRVTGNLPGLGAGGGTEYIFNTNIPAKLIK